MKIAKNFGRENSSVLRERIAQYGIDSLLDEEIMHLLTGISVETIRSGIMDYGMGDFVIYADALNMTNIQRRKLAMLYEFCKRLSLAPFKERALMDSSSKVGEYMTKELQGYPKEVFVVVFLNSQNKLIAKEILFEGTVNETQIYPREIIKKALQYNANSVIWGHNHPGGSMQASSADIESTKRIGLDLTAVSIKLIDHIIVGGGRYMSFAESGLL